MPVHHYGALNYPSPPPSRYDNKIKAPAKYNDTMRVCYTSKITAINGKVGCNTCIKLPLPLLLSHAAVLLDVLVGACPPACPSAAAIRPAASAGATMGRLCS